MRHCTCFRNKKSNQSPFAICMSMFVKFFLKRPEWQKSLVNSPHTRAIFFRQVFTLKLFMYFGQIMKTSLRGKRILRAIVA